MISIPQRIMRVARLHCVHLGKSTTSHLSAPLRRQSGQDQFRIIYIYFFVLIQNVFPRYAESGRTRRDVTALTKRTAAAVFLSIERLGLHLRPRQCRRDRKRHAKRVASHETLTRRWPSASRFLQCTSAWLL